MALSAAADSDDFTCDWNWANGSIEFLNESECSFFYFLYKYIFFLLLFLIIERNGGGNQRRGNSVPLFSTQHYSSN